MSNEEGRPWAAEHVVTAEVAARLVAEQFADLGPVRLRPLGVPGDDFRRLDVTKRVAMTRERLREAVEKGLLDGAGEWLELVEEASCNFVPGESTLVHGDLYARHVLVDGGRRPAGVIDWGDVHLGDPAIDLALVFAFLPPVGRERFFEIYGEVGEERRAVARLRAVFSSVTFLVYGHDVGDEALVREGRVALRYSGA